MSDPALQAMRDALWGRYPALPVTVIEEAARYLTPQRIGTTTRPRRYGILFVRLARIAARFRPT
ncbi:hypothetical protein [Roseomonas sp. CAU 1739]|uniref:hypothetical protein n=1 Tax=Roseomonas sp. CAU 1739 TaxID=3140364 RepID=UPI00325B366D